MAKAESVAEVPTVDPNAAMAMAIVNALDQSAKKREVEEAKRTKNNPNFDATSVFRPQGEAAFLESDVASFHRQPFFNNARVDITQLVPEEIRAYNVLSDSLKASGDRRTSRNGRWEVKVSSNNDQIHLLVPCKTEEDRTEVNAIPIRMILLELTSGAEAANPNMLLDQVTAMKQQIAELQAAKAGA